MLLSKKLLMGGAGVQSYWIALLGGTGSDIGWSVTTDSAGDIIVTGYTDSTGAGSNDFLIAKYSSAGALQWQRTLGGTGGDVGLSVTTDSAGNVIVTGQTASAGAGSNDFLIAKYSSAGTLQWQRTLGGTGGDIGYSVAVDSAGNVIVTGQTASAGAGSNDFLIAKYSSAGALQWQRTLGGTGSDIGWSVTTDSAGDIIVTGYTDSTGAGSNDFLIAKYSSAGALQWQRTLGGTGGDIGYSVAVDSAGNVVVAGYTDSTGAGSNDFLIAKYSSAGALQWQRTLGGTGSDIGWSVTVDSAGDIIVTGYTDSTGAGLSGFLIAKYDSAGTLQWQRTLGGTGGDVGLSVTTDSAGNIIVTGYTDSAGAGSFGFMVAKLPPDGSLTGTYGPFTYQASSLTDAASSLTDASSALSDAASSLTDAASSLTDQAAALTENFYEVV